ncbi:MAG: hypothetical protein DRO06_04535 [Thermoproteota archaeon]|nr:MAG: hypothetical protein DRO06_04535 [Candidatus Korarchaeota archaeon]
MPRVRFRFYLTAREVIGSKEVEVEPPGPTLGEALAALRERLGEKSRVVFDGDGSLKAHYTLIMDGEVIRLPRGLSREIPDGAVIDVLPPVGGG